MTPSLFTQRLQAWFGVTILAQMLTTPRLWFVLPPDRPVFVPLLFDAPGWVHLGLSGLLAGAAFTLLIRPRHRYAPIIAAVLIALLCGLDELRLQPWAWLLLLCGLLFFQARRRDGRQGDVFIAQHLRVMLIGLYLWAALHKINSGFFEQTVPFFLEPFGFNEPAAWLTGLFGALIIASEAGLGVLLARSGDFDRYALRLGVVLHLVVLGILGPSGQNYDPNVWTWNVSQAALLFLLLHKGGSRVGLVEILKPRARLTLVLAGLVLLMPALHVVRIAPANISWALYAGNYDLGLLAAQHSASSPEIDRSIMPFPPRIVRAVYEYAQGELGSIEGLQDVAYPPQIMKELGVTHPPDAGFMRRLQAVLCDEIDPILLLRRKHLPFARTTMLRIERCDGSVAEIKVPPFL